VQVTQGTLYPALHRLENRGYLAADWKPSDTGREAKFYRLTPAGRRALRAETQSWNDYVAAVARVMTDNGSCYVARDFAKACKRLRLKHIRTKPYTPKTNGKAERFIQTALREWAYATAFASSDQRAEELPVWMHRYNWHRPHGGIKCQTPINRLGLTRDNLLRLHS